jgi:hypothetical protein
MIATPHELLAAFDALDPVQKQQVAVEILRRSAAQHEMADDAFLELAAEVFRVYDSEESSGGSR